VTHYRHIHRKSYDSAWSNDRYASKIPNYDYHELRATVNECAKRQLIRAIKKLVIENRYPSDVAVSAIDLVQGFSRLSGNDEKTTDLINRVSDFLNYHPTRTLQRNSSS
jgi:hypothetical protein